MYRFVLLHDGDDGWADEVEQSLREAVTRMGLDPDLLRRVDSANAHEANPTVGVYLGSVAAARNGELERRLFGLARDGHAIIPLHHSEHDVPSVMPPSLQPLNALDWCDDRRVEDVNAILRTIGLAESERKVFLSYRRADATNVALQLHTALVRRGFDVFLDRFSVDAGADFQRRIHIDLADKAFVLFVESRDARSSRWVEEEVTYAMSHHIAHLAVTLPGVSREQQFSTIDDAFRLRLRESDLVPGSDADRELTDAALRLVLDEIEMGYAGLVRRRREQIVGSLVEALTEDGCDVTPTGDWGIVARPDAGKPGATKVFIATVRAPAVADLHLLDQLCEPLRCSDPPMVIDASVVHPAEDLDEEVAALVSWVGAGRSLSTVLLSELML
jgi:hypothetical protein